MGNFAQIVSFEPVRWGAIAARHFAQIEGLTSHDLANYAIGVASTAKGLCAIEVDGKRRGSILWSVQDEPNGTFLVIDEAFCEPVPGVQIAREIEAFADEMAKRVGATKLRFWTRREGLRRMMSDRFSCLYVMEAEAHG
jgi:hypothetical protein